MKKVALSNVEDGMILAEPLTGASGNILMGKGIALRASIVPRLQSWGVTHVWVEGEPDAAGFQTLQTDTQAAESLDKLFGDKQNLFPMDIIFKSLLRHRSQVVER